MPLGMLVEMAGKRAVERGDGDGVLHQRAGIRRPQFERRMLERGADRPPDVARILDDAGPHQRADIGVEFLAVAEQLRHAGARQFVVGGKPVALEPGRPTIARTATRSTARRTAAGRAGSAASRRRARRVRAVRRAHASRTTGRAGRSSAGRPSRCRSVPAASAGPCARARSDACRRPGSPVPCSAAIVATVSRKWRSSARASSMSAMRRGDHLDLRLQEFGCRPAVGRGLGGIEERLRHVRRDALGLRVDQEVLFLDAEGEIVGHVVARHPCCSAVACNGVDACSRCSRKSLETRRFTVRRSAGGSGKLGSAVLVAADRSVPERRFEAQCDIRTGTVMAPSMLRVTPPQMNSRSREWP